MFSEQKVEEVKLVVFEGSECECQIISECNKSNFWTASSFSKKKNWWLAFRIVFYKWRSSGLNFDEGSQFNFLDKQKLQYQEMSKSLTISAVLYNQDSIARYKYNHLYLFSLAKVKMVNWDLKTRRQNNTFQQTGDLIQRCTSLVRSFLYFQPTRSLTQRNNCWFVWWNFQFKEKLLDWYLHRKSEAGSVEETLVWLSSYVST